MKLFSDYMESCKWPIIIFQYYIDFVLKYLLTFYKFFFHNDKMTHACEKMKKKMMLNKNPNVVLCQILEPAI